MGTTGKDHRNIPVSNLNGTFTFYEVPKQLGCIAVLKAPELSCQHGIERIGDHGHQHIEVDLEQNGRRQGIEIEEAHGLGNAVLHPPAARIVTHEQLNREIGVVADQEGRCLAAIVLHDDLAQRPFIST